MADINEIFSQGALDGIQKAIEMMAKLEISVTKLVQQSKQLDATLSKASGIKSNTEQQKALNKGKSEAARIQQAYQRELEKTKVVHGAMNKALIAQKTANQQATAEIKRNQAVVKSAAGSYDQLNAALKRDIAEFKKLSAAERENSQRGKELKNSIQQNQKALKDLDKQMGNHQRNVGNYSSALKGLKTNYLAIAAAAAGFFALLKKGIGLLSGSVDAFDKEIVANKKLEVALGGVSQALTSQASALQAKTRYGNESILEGQAFLAQMQLTEKQIESITPLILDFAAGYNMDLNSAFQLVAKTLGSTTNALSRYGIQIEGAAGSNERMESAANALTKSFKGNAEALAEIGKGPIVQFRNLWGDLMERVGSFVTRGINPLIKGLSNLITIQTKESDQLINQQTELNALVGMITNVNTSEQVRSDLLTELTDKYPGFLGELEKEKVTNQQLKDLLTDINQQFKIKIAQTIAEEELAGIQERLLENYKAERQELKEIERVKASAMLEPFRSQNIGVFEENIRYYQAERKEIEAQIQAKQEEVTAWINSFTAIDKVSGLLLKKKGKTTEDTESTDDNTSSIEEQVKAYMKLIAAQERLAALEDVPDVDVGDAPEIGTEKWRTDADYYNEIWRESYEGRMQTLKDQLKAGEISEAEYKDKILAIKQEQADKEQEIGEERAEKAVELASMIASRTMEIYQQSIDQQIQSLETQKQYELNLNQGSLEAQERIQKKYAKKEAELKRKKAIADKAAALVQAAINTAVAVTAATTAGPGIGLALAIITAAFNAIQLGVIASQPIPQFRKGTKASPAGLAIVGEEGTELMIGPRGQVALSGDKPEARMLHAGTRVFTAKETQKIMAAAKGYDSYEMMAIAETIREGDEKIYRAIKDQPQFTVQKDKRRVTERRGSYYKTYLNAKLGI